MCVFTVYALEQERFMQHNIEPRELQSQNSHTFHRSSVVVVGWNFLCVVYSLSRSLQCTQSCQAFRFDDHTVNFPPKYPRSLSCVQLSSPSSWNLCIVLMLAITENSILLPARLELEFPWKDRRSLQIIYSRLIFAVWWNFRGKSNDERINVSWKIEGQYAMIVFILLMKWSGFSLLFAFNSIVCSLACRHISPSRMCKYLTSDLFTIQWSDLVNCRWMLTFKEEKWYSRYFSFSVVLSRSLKFINFLHMNF